MVLEKIQVGNRVRVVDRENNLLFTNTEIRRARERFIQEAGRELGKKIKNM